ncbi:MAG: hypothetical protein ACYTEQ_29655 [Planctomycetota bacterium]|jgi:hypothetical protein
MTQNSNVTAQSVNARAVNARVDKMGEVFVELQQGVEAINQLVCGLLAYDDDEMTVLLKQVGDLQDKLTGLPAQKRELAEALAAKRQEINSMKARIELIEANLFLNVSSQIIPETGKLEYTNKEQREAALVLARSDDKDLVKLDGQLSKLEFEKAALVAQLNELEDTCKISREMYGGCVARLNNFTARISYNGREK